MTQPRINKDTKFNIIQREANIGLWTNIPDFTYPLNTPYWTLPFTSAYIHTYQKCPTYIGYYTELQKFPPLHNNRKHIQENIHQQQPRKKINE